MKKESSLKGKQFDLSNVERRLASEILEKAAKKRRSAEKMEQRMLLEIRHEVLTRAGASPEELQALTVNFKVTDTANGKLPLSLEVVGVAPAGKAASKPKLKALKGGKKEQPE